MAINKVKYQQWEGFFIYVELRYIKDGSMNLWQINGEIMEMCY